MLRGGLDFFFSLFYFINSDMLWFLVCNKCTYCKMYWTKAFAECPKCECKYCMSSHGDGNLATKSDIALSDGGKV